MATHLRAHNRRKLVATVRVFLTVGSWTPETVGVFSTGFLDPPTGPDLAGKPTVRKKALPVATTLGHAAAEVNLSIVIRIMAKDPFASAWRAVAHAAGRHPETMKMTPHPRCSGPPPSYLGHPLPRGEGGDPAKWERRVRGFFKAVGRGGRLLLALLLCWLSCLTLVDVKASAGSSSGQAVSDARELLDQLNNSTIDPSQVYVLRDAQITRDRVRIYFNRGFVGFLKQTGGETNGAVFTGDGEVLLTPPSAMEKLSLAQFTQTPVLEERFTTAYLRFTDATAKQLLAQARPPDPESTEQPTRFVEQWNAVVLRLNPYYSSRVLQDLVGDRSRPFFHAQIRGVNLGVFEVTVDERLPEAVRVGANRLSNGRTYSDIWCSFPSRASTGKPPVSDAAVAASYRLDTRINPDKSLEGHADVELESRSSVDRLLFFELSRALRVTEVKDQSGQNVEVFQDSSEDDSEEAVRGDDRILVVLPSARPTGEKYHLSFSYQGNLIADAGNGVLYVGAHSSWYPNLRLWARATFDLTFRYPDRLTLVATGRRVEESAADGWKRSRWASDSPLPVVGFNLGAYDSRVRHVGSTAVEVYATRQVEAELEKRHAATQPPADLIMRPSGAEGRPSISIAPRGVTPLEPMAALGPVADRAAHAVSEFEVLFGPFPYSRLAISQVPGSFGQGWPELVYLPTLQFLPLEERKEMGLGGQPDVVQDNLQLAHEVAHQWWGNQVGWKTYHDQWLSEGFATYAAALCLATEKDGERKFHELLQEYKRDLLSKDKEGHTIESGGPIWLGERLSTSLNPEGYDAIIYKKACWVLHMLRCLMKQPAATQASGRHSGSAADEKFFEMLRAFLADYKGQAPSTEDFVRYAERYVTPASDLDHNGKLDWFFNEWVYGTGIPTYSLHATIKTLAPDRFVVQGTIDQNEAPADSEMLVPVIAAFGKDGKITLGRVAVSESSGSFRFTTATKPSRVAIDEDEILAVVR